MNITSKIVTAMVQKYDQYKPKGIIYKPILSFLQDLQKMGFEFEETVKNMVFISKFSFISLYLLVYRLTLICTKY
jgi:hypothetical protein